MTLSAAGSPVRSGAILVAMAMVQAMAEAPDPILIEGETGTGKTVLARRIHERSGRRGPFVAKTIPSIPESLQQSILFGHVRGAFTGASADHCGLIESAQGGSLFLDEIGEAAPSTQAALLEVVEAGTITRLGEVRSRPVSVRIIAATNADLDDNDVFRRDLLQRFGSFRIRLPPLRERRDEIIPLFCQFLAEVASQANAGETLRTPLLDPGVEEVLLAVPWRGNIRELRKEARYAGYMSRGTWPIRFDHLSPFLQAEGEVALERATPAVARRHAQARLEARALQEAEGGDIQAVAARLNVSERRVYQILAERTIGSALPRQARPGRHH